MFAQIEQITANIITITIMYVSCYKPEFFLVDNSSHIISESPRTSRNRALLRHCELEWREGKRTSHFDQMFSKQTFVVKSPRFTFSARRQTTPLTIMERLGTRIRLSTSCKHQQKNGILFFRFPFSLPSFH